MNIFVRLFIAVCVVSVPTDYVVAMDMQLDSLTELSELEINDALAEVK